MNKRRWSDNQRAWGPFTWARDRAWTWAFVVNSGDEENPGCHLMVRGFGWTLLVELPGLLAPYRERVQARWDAATIERLGRDWYFHVDEREYGVRLFEGHFNLMYGRQTDDSSTEQRWSCFLPWTQWRHVRHSYYGLSGEHFRTAGDSFDEWKAARDACPSIMFSFADFDGEHINARTWIEEREWWFGTGWCRWLAWFWPRKVVRSLEIEFSSEVGRRKGSWKGGTIGHGIEMQRGELHESAFRRYCAQHEMVFLQFTNAALLAVGEERRDG